MRVQIITGHFMLLMLLPLLGFSQNTGMNWKAGVARINITPDQSMWIDGYGSRDHPSEGVRQDVWIKAVALEDRNGERGVMVSMDLCDLSKKSSDRIRDRLEDKLHLGRKQIILNVSHTHSGPMMRDDAFDIPESEVEKVRSFTENLEKQVVNLVEMSFQDLAPVTIYSGNGLTRFQVNRRNNVESELKSYTELKGPNDFAVPVIKVVDEKNIMKALLFGYACHPTVLSDYMISGDYSGYAQIALEEWYPGTTALFFQGAGGDLNPLPRREQQLAEQYGHELAAAVNRVLKSDMRSLNANLSVSYSEVRIGMQDAPPGADEIKSYMEANPGDRNYYKHRARVLLDELNSPEGLEKDYPYPVQAWRMGEQLIFALGGELLVGYAIELKRIFGDDIFVYGYCNDVMGYVPTLKVLREGGYEANLSPYVTNSWEPNIEYLIIKEAKKLAKKIGVEN